MCESESEGKSKSKTTAWRQKFFARGSCGRESLLWYTDTDSLSNHAVCVTDNLVGLGTFVAIEKRCRSEIVQGFDAVI